MFIKKNITLITVSLVSALIILLGPILAFSSEQFAKQFYPNGGIIHEASFALIISLILLVTALLKNLSLKTVISFSFLTAFFESLIYIFLHIRDKNLPPFILYAGAILLFGTTYYFAIISAPASLAVLIRKFINKLISTHSAN